MRRGRANERCFRWQYPFLFISPSPPTPPAVQRCKGDGSGRSQSLRLTKIFLTKKRCAPLHTHSRPIYYSIWGILLVMSKDHVSDGYIHILCGVVDQRNSFVKSSSLHNTEEWAKGNGQRIAFYFWAISSCKKFMYEKKISSSSIFLPPSNFFASQK